MLALPASGFSPSIASHNVRIDVLCDWLEGSVVFGKAQLAASEVVDLMIENGIYEDQGFAWERMADAWAELKRRSDLLKDGYPVGIEGWRLKRRRLLVEEPGAQLLSCALPLRMAARLGRLMR